MGVPALFSTDSLLTPEEGATAGLASSRQISLNNPHKQKTDTINVSGFLYIRITIIYSYWFSI
ncbi:hypothetical protein VEGS15_17540 [Escherichia coli]|nr:hypothetical protein VEGS15_17540 [Escherichia coli]